MKEVCVVVVVVVGGFGALWVLDTIQVLYL